MHKQSIVAIIYNVSYYFYCNTNTWTPFFHWLKRIKAVKNINYFPLNDFHVYIDIEKIDYLQLLSLWSIFAAFKINDREQLEQLLPYLSPGDAKDFEKHYLKPWKNRKLKEKITDG